MHSQENVHQQQSNTSIANAQNTNSSQSMSVQAPQYQVSSAEGEGGPDCDCYDNILKVIKAQRDRWGTDEEAIYSAIRSCPSRGRLKGDMHALHDLRKEMGGHDLWKAYLLITFGSESNFPKPIQDIWDATKGMGTDEEKVFSALESMDASMRKTFGLGYILKKEMSGKDLAKALGIMNAREGEGDSIQGNLFGHPDAAEGTRDFIINPDNAIELIGAEFEGGGSEGLAEAMRVLQEDNVSQEDKEKYVGAVATIRGIPVELAMQQYENAIELRTQGINTYKNNKLNKGQTYDDIADNPAPLLSDENMAFMGSNAQLAFGKIIGDVFNMDPVFGSLMSPTGGMAGGGNERVMGVADGSAVATHGAVHDAGGFLKNCFNIGPGYDYFQSEAGSDPTHHLAGQTNIRWWIEQYEAKGIKRGLINGKYQEMLADNAHKGGAFAKIHSNLTLEEKKEVLGIICGINTIMLKVVDLSNDDRVGEVQEMMSVSSDEEKRELANHYYNNDGFGGILAAGAIGRIMRPHVDNDVYNRYLMRRSM